MSTSALHRASSVGHASRSGRGWRPLVARTSGSATEGIYVLGAGVSVDRALTRAGFAHTAREHWSLVEVVIPLVVVLLKVFLH